MAPYLHLARLAGEKIPAVFGERHGAIRPNVRGIVLALRGKVGFGKNFKGVTSGFFIWQRCDAGFKLGKAGESGEQLAVNISRRFEVLCLWHDHKIKPIERCGQFIYARPMPVTLPPTNIQTCRY